MNRSFKLRLIVPYCKFDEEFYSNDSLLLYKRKQLLIEAMECDDIDLIVTSHNFFRFRPIKSDQQFFQNQVINVFLNQIPLQKRKPIVIGFDFYGENKLNPYSSNPAMVGAFGINNTFEYIYITHIWEVWNGGKCNAQNFIAQNHKRIFKINKYKIGLLSCGDIAPNCHCQLQFLPNADIYLDLSHTSLHYRTPHYHQASKMIQNGICDYVFITFQIKSIQTLNKYINTNNYKFIFPAYTNYTITRYNKYSNIGAFIDLTI